MLLRNRDYTSINNLDLSLGHHFDGFPLDGDRSYREDVEVVRLAKDGDADDLISGEALVEELVLDVAAKEDVVVLG